MFYYSPYSLTDLDINYLSTHGILHMVSGTYGLYAPLAFSK